MSIPQEIAAIYNAGRQAARRATNEAAESYLPGRTNGPADAYRHILISAELTRLFGEPVARRIMDNHEIFNRRNTPETAGMDLDNNDIGYSIGRNPNVTTWDDVVREARARINPQNPNGTGGQDAKWLPEQDPNGNKANDWSNNPKSL